MRTTLTLDDAIAAKLRQIAHEADKPFKQVVNETLAAGLAKSSDSPTVEVHLPAFSLGTPHAAFDLDKAVRLAGDLEDMELQRKLEMRK